MFSDTPNGMAIGCIWV